MPLLPPPPPPAEWAAGGNPAEEEAFQEYDEEEEYDDDEDYDEAEEYEAEEHPAAAAASTSEGGRVLIVQRPQVCCAGLPCAQGRCTAAMPTSSSHPAPSSGAGAHAGGQQPLNR